MQVSVDNLFWFTQDALQQLGTGRMGHGVSLRGGPVLQIGSGTRITLFGETQYQDFGEVDGLFVYRNQTVVRYSSRPWLFFGGMGAGINWALSNFVLAGLEAGGGWVRYSCPLSFSSSQEYLLAGRGAASGANVPFKGDTYYLQAGAGLTFRLWHSRPPQIQIGAGEIPAELLLKFRFNYCRGGELECLRRESFRTSAEVPLHFESSRAPLSQTQMRVGLGFTL